MDLLLCASRAIAAPTSGAPAAAASVVSAKARARRRVNEKEVKTSAKKVVLQKRERAICRLASNSCCNFSLTKKRPGSEQKPLVADPSTVVVV